MESTIERDDVRLLGTPAQVERALGDQPQDLGHAGRDAGDRAGTARAERHRRFRPDGLGDADVYWDPVPMVVGGDGTYGGSDGTFGAPSYGDVL